MKEGLAKQLGVVIAVVVADVVVVVWQLKCKDAALVDEASSAQKQHGYQYIQPIYLNFDHCLSSVCHFPVAAAVAADVPRRTLPN
eukprot:15136407-Ditylum_brightwellii.AAC.1